MAIKGLTDNVIPRLPGLGKLRKGGEKQAGKYGKDLEFFRFTSENPAIVAAFTEAYGQQPAMLRVYLPYPSTEMNFSTWKEAWAAGGLVHRCDGETCTIWRTPDGKYSQVPKPCPGGCKEVGRLEVILPELITAGFVGYVTLETHSLHDLMNITATLEAVRQSAQDRPNGLQGIEFVLRRKKERISTPDGKGGRASREKWLVSIEPVPSWAQTYLAMASNTLAIEAPRVDMLTGEVLDDDDDEDDGEIIEGTATLTEEPRQHPKPQGNGSSRAPLGFAVWADWSRPEHAIAWGMAQGVFDHQRHAENAYAKVKTASNPTSAKEMWAAWYLDVQRRIAERDAADKPASNDKPADPDGWDDIDAHGVELPQFS